MTILQALALTVILLGILLVLGRITYQLERLVRVWEQSP
jgi:hypothetical protein